MGIRGGVEDTREEDEVASDGAAAELVLGELEEGRDQDVVGAVEEDKVDDDGAEDERDEEEAGELVLEEQLLDTHVAAGEPEGDDDGTEGCDPP